MTSRYVLDTNTLSKLIKTPPESLVTRLHAESNSTLLISEAVVYEIERGLFKLNATRQLTRFRERILTNFTVIPVDLAHWRAAAELWADAARRGRALSDIDLLIAALALRFDAIIVTTDQDFAAFPSLHIENWR